MGLLDDAIREHLELKRRRGADPAEVERAEREALGPVRRKEPSDLAGPGDEAAAVEGVAHDEPAPEVAWDEERAMPAGDAATHEDELAAYDEEPEAAATDEPSWHHAVDDEPEPFATAPPARGRGDELDMEGDETAEYRLEGDAAPRREDDESEGEDMLEETPEFLQDTPDHDRLWFEQRPPRDFDFDG